MVTAEEVIRDAFFDALVEGAETELQASEYQAGIRALNDFMLDLDANGTVLGFTRVSSLGDPVTVPDGCIFGVKKNLAVYLANQFGSPISDGLQRAAIQGMKTMKKAAVLLVSAQYPNTVPLGSGNYYYGRTNGYRFFPNRETEIKRENNQSIAVEDSTDAS